MTFAFANYLGAAGGWEPLFQWLAFALYLPVVTYVALPFYKGAWRSLKNRQLSIDLPMAVVGMSCFFSASVRAPMTGMVLVIEMTASTAVIVPMLAATAAAVLVAHLVGSPPIYDSLRERSLSKF